MNRSHLIYFDPAIKTSERSGRCVGVLAVPGRMVASSRCAEDITHSLLFAPVKLVNSQGGI